MARMNVQTPCYNLTFMAGSTWSKGRHVHVNSSVIELVVIGGLALIVVLANYAETRPFLRAPVHGILAVIDFIFMVYFAFPPPETTLTRVNATATTLAP